MSEPFLQTSCGKFYFLHPETYNYTPEEIFKVLSRAGRFNHHGNIEFTVGQHLIHVLSISESKDHAIDLLLHDSAETYYTDLPSPLKALLPQYKELEQDCLKAIYKAFKLDYPTDDILAYVKKYDLKALYDEGKYLFDIKDNYFENLGEDSILVKTISALTPNQVYDILIKEFYSLTKTKCHECGNILLVKNNFAVLNKKDIK